MLGTQQRINKNLYSQGFEWEETDNQERGNTLEKGQGWYVAGLLFFFFFFFVFLGLYLRHMEVRRLGIQLELQLAAYTRATATPDPSHVCHLHHSSRPHQILNLLSKARDRTCILVVTSLTRFC